MKNLFKKTIALVLSMVILISICSVSAFAAEGPARHSTLVSSYPETPGGVLSKEEILKRQNDRIKPQAGSSQTYQYIDITESYNGERDRGIVMKGSNNRTGTGTDSCIVLLQ